MRKKILSLNKKDFKIDYFNGQGAGGQHRNKHQNCVRLQHLESGASAVCQDHKSQLHNKKEALKRLTETSKFKLWLNMKVNEIVTGETIEKQVENDMKPENLKIETKEGGKWQVNNNI